MFIKNENKLKMTRFADLTGTSNVRLTCSTDNELTSLENVGCHVNFHPASVMLKKSWAGMSTIQKRKS